MIAVPAKLPVYTECRPVLKWAGSKGQLLEQIEQKLPLKLKMGGIKRYIEPFVGGGACNGKYSWRTKNGKPLNDFIKYIKNAQSIRFYHDHSVFPNGRFLFSHLAHKFQHLVDAALDRNTD